MSFDELLQPDVQEFILKNLSADVTALGLKKLPFNPEVRSQILSQITARQKANGKLDKWRTTKGIIFPAPDLVEQASSEQTALYKSGIIPGGDCFMDLTAGMGIDTLSFLSHFKEAYCIEASAINAALLEHNLPYMSSKKIHVINNLAEKVVETLPSVDFIYIDPQRRESSGKKGLFDLSQTKPNIVELLPILKQKAPLMMVKTSPYLDIAEGVRQLGDVAEVHVVEAQGQCKEVLYIIKRGHGSAPARIYAAQCDKQTSFCPAANTQTPLPYDDAQNYLFEPCPALMKANTHEAYAASHNLIKIAPMTHLYTSMHEISGLMGRCFKVSAVIPVKKEAVHAALPKAQANITVRNFPMKPEDLRKKLSLKDGGAQTLFACTLHNGDKRLILCAHV